MSTATLLPEIGRELGRNTLEPRPYQMEAFLAARRVLTTDRSTAIILPTGCHDPDQGLLTFDGTVRQAWTIEIGDELMGPDSFPRRVLAVHEGRKPMVRVIPVKGQSFVVTEDHMLTLVRTREEREPKYPCQRKAGEVLDVAAKDWMAWSKSRKHIYKLCRTGVVFPEQPDQCFHPYLLGVLLGDGSIKRGSISVASQDAEIFEFIEEIADGMSGSGYRTRLEAYDGKCPQIFLAGNRVGRRGGVIQNQLRLLGLFGTDSGSKFIPHRNKIGSTTERLSLLAGLMDTDGSLTSGCYDYISKSKTLADDVVYVARSLGFAAYPSECWKVDQNGHGGIYHRVSISGNVSEIPCRVPRKQAPDRRQIKDVLRTGFHVEPCGDGEYRGFTVDGDHRYLMDDFTVTHNCGKTVVFASIARSCVERGGRVLVLAHRKELIDQAANTIERVGILPGIERGDQYARAAFEPHVVVASKDSLHPKRIASWEHDHFRLIITDECHRATATTYERVFKHFSTAKLLGVTATPDRADEDEILDVFGSIAYEMSIWDAMTAEPPGPWLCRLKFVQCDVQIDLRGIRTTGGDFNAADLEARIRPLVDLLANAIRQEIGSRPTLVFCPDVGSSQAMATALQSLGISAEWVAGIDPERERKIADYKAGRYQVLANCMLLTEGFDAPSTAAIVLCRPTKSRPLYAQMVGRGTRLKTGLAHEDCLLIDFAFLTDKHDLCRPADLFDRSDKSDEENSLVEKMLAESVAKGEKADLIDVVERAGKKHKELQVLRIKAREREVKYRRVAFDPLSMADALGVTMRQGVGAVHTPATPKQIEVLGKFRVRDCERISKRQATRLLDVFFERSRAGLASAAQVSYLIALGERPEIARNFSRQEASSRIDALKR